MASKHNLFGRSGRTEVTGWDYTIKLQEQNRKLQADHEALVRAVEWMSDCRDNDELVDQFEAALDQLEALIGGEK